MFSSNNSEELKNRIVYLSDTVWNVQLGNLISKKTISVWNSLLNGLTKYHEKLSERKKLILETNKLHEKNKELKNLLKVFIDKEDNKALLVPPYQTIKVDKFNYAFSELGSTSSTNIG